MGLTACHDYETFSIICDGPLKTSQDRSPSVFLYMYFFISCYMYVFTSWYHFVILSLPRKRLRTLLKGNWAAWFITDECTALPLWIKNEMETPGTWLIWITWGKFRRQRSPLSSTKFSGEISLLHEQWGKFVVFREQRNPRRSWYYLN